MTLLSYAGQQSIKKISENNASKYSILATEVENKELRELLGIAFCQYIQANPNNADVKKLLEGATFTCGNATYKHRGLYFVIAYLNYSKYIYTSYITDTFTGFVKNNRTDAESLSNGDITRLKDDAIAIALGEFEIIKMYLDTQNFELWNKAKSISPKKPILYGIRKTAN